MNPRIKAEGGMLRGDESRASVSDSSHMRRPSSSRVFQQGFTLLEMIMVLSLVAMISGMVFGVMRVSLRTAVETQKMQMEDDELNRFIRLCRHTFQNLPATAVLTLKITETGTPVQQELTIAAVPEAFAFGANPMSYKDSILGQRPDIEATTANETGTELYYVGLSREDLIPVDPTRADQIASTTGEGLATPDDQGRYWMPLLANVTSLTWRFYREDQDEWVEEWDSTTLPQLVEMNLLLNGRTLPLRSIFAVPTTKLTSANPALAPRTSTTSGSTSSTQSTGGGGGPGGGGPGGGGDRGGGDRGSRGSGGKDGGSGGDRGGGDRGGGDRGGGDRGGGDRGGGDRGGGGPRGPQGGAGGGNNSNNNGGGGTNRN
jgi:prepilin-type N-terminal cleavage/methylation domain-containing protein